MKCLEARSQVDVEREEVKEVTRLYAQLRRKKQRAEVSVAAGYLTSKVTGSFTQLRRHERKGEGNGEASEERCQRWRDHNHDSGGRIKEVMDVPRS